MCCTHWNKSTSVPRGPACAQCWDETLGGYETSLATACASRTAYVLGGRIIHTRRETCLLPRWEEKLLFLERGRRGQGQKRLRSVRIRLASPEKWGSRAPKKRSSELGKGLEHQRACKCKDQNRPAKSSEEPGRLASFPFWWLWKPDSESWIRVHR